MEEKKRTFRVKLGTGVHAVRLPNGQRRKVKPGETFEDYLDSRNVVRHMHKLEVVDSGVSVVSVEEEIEKVEKEEEATPVEASKMKVVSISPTRFDVINIETGEKLNDSPMTKKEVDSLMGAEEYDVEEDKEVKEKKEVKKKPSTKKKTTTKKKSSGKKRTKL